MTFRDQILQRHVERASACITEVPNDQLAICGLLDAEHWFRVSEGEDSPRAAEAVEHLLSVELRPALRRWYQRYGDDMNTNAIGFRDKLSNLAGERFG
jgi:hypothetical protein